MPSSNSRIYGPPWLCWSCCALWQLPIPVLLVAVIFGATPASILVWAPFLLVPAHRSLHILVTGRSPRSGLEVTMQLLGAVTQIRERDR